MKREREEIDRQIPAEVWILFGMNLCSFCESDEWSPKCESLSLYMQTSKFLQKNAQLQAILQSWRLRLSCVVCRCKRGENHSNCDVGSETCQFPPTACRSNSLCDDCSVSCDWCGWNNCGCLEMERSCTYCETLFCSRCDCDPNVLVDDSTVRICWNCRRVENGSLLPLRVGLSD